MDKRLYFVKNIAQIQMQIFLIESHRNVFCKYLMLCEQFPRISHFYHEQ